MARRISYEEKNPGVAAAYAPESYIEMMQELLRQKRTQNDAIGMALRDEDRKQRRIQEILGEITALEKPEFYNPPEGSNVMPIRPGMEGFSEETGIYRTEPATTTNPYDRKGHLGAFSNIGSTAGPRMADTEEGRTRLESLKEETGLLGYAGKGTRSAATDKELPEQRLIREQINKDRDELKSLDVLKMGSREAYDARKQELETSIAEGTRRYTEAGSKGKTTEPSVKRKSWFGTKPTEEKKGPTPDEKGPNQPPSWKDYQVKAVAVTDKPTPPEKPATRQPLTISLNQPDPDTEEARQVRKAVSKSMGSEGLKRAQAQFNADLSKGFEVDDSLVRVARTFGQAVAKLIRDNLSQPVPEGMVRRPQYYKGAGTGQTLLGGIR